MLTAERGSALANVTANLDRQARQYGAEVVDVKIMRTDLPEARLQSAFRRMESASAREARTIRAQGDRDARIIRADADADATALMAGCALLGIRMQGLINPDTEIAPIRDALIESLRARLAP